jgi:hypothetical protein
VTATKLLATWTLLFVTQSAADLTKRMAFMIITSVYASATKPFTNTTEARRPKTVLGPKKTSVMARRTKPRITPLSTPGVLLSLIVARSKPSMTKTSVWDAITKPFAVRHSPSFALTGVFVAKEKLSLIPSNEGVQLCSVAIRIENIIVGIWCLRSRPTRRLFQRDSFVRKEIALPRTNCLHHSSCWFRFNIAMKKGPPMSAVIAPTGISVGDNSVRAPVSHKMRNAPPRKNAPGTRIR